MANFSAILGGTQSADGFTVTFSDSSPYGSASSQNYQPTDFTRSIVLTDAYNNILATLSLPGSQLTANYTLTTDKWISAELILAGNTLYSVTNIFPFSRITKNAYRALLQQGCCQSCKIEKILDVATQYLTGADYEAPTGNGPGFQQDIDAAYSYLTSPAYA